MIDKIKEGESPSLIFEAGEKIVALINFTWQSAKEARTSEESHSMAQSHREFVKELYEHCDYYNYNHYPIIYD